MLVSVITVTYNRSRFIPELLKCYDSQLYKQTEWIILDDSDSEEQSRTEALVQEFSKTHPNICYRVTGRKPMGSKLNEAAKLCRGEIIIVMDDDDYYPPTRISTAVKAFQSNPTYQIAGCSKVYMYFQEETSTYVAGPYHDRHALHCTMAYRSSYLKTHQYDDNEPCAIERVFTNDFTEPMIQLNPKKTILHMVHSTNTYRHKKTIGLLRKLTKFDTPITNFNELVI
jgi:glycosyltransferase involved in cell wall biosynthesis